MMTYQLPISNLKVSNPKKVLDVVNCEITAEKVKDYSQIQLFAFTSDDISKVVYIP